MGKGARGGQGVGVMARVSFKQCDLKRAIAAALAAGLDPEIRIRPGGEIVIAERDGRDDAEREIARWAEEQADA